MKKPIYAHLVTAIDAKKTCEKRDAELWWDRWDRLISEIETNHLPNGSRIDSGCLVDQERSNDRTLVINSAYHCMNDPGYYEGWINFKVVGKPSLQFGITLEIKGNFGMKGGKYALEKEYLHELFYEALIKEVDL